MRERIARYRRATAIEEDPEVGCVMLRDVRFFPAEHVLSAPADWSPNIVQGKSYEVSEVVGSPVEAALAALLADSLERRDLEPVAAVPGDVFGPPRLAPVRVGQRAFKALVQEAYGRRCAITGEKIVPVLQAAHIRPVTREGENRVDNGLLLRSDVHTLFDMGYLGLHPERKTLLVSPRLRRDWANGEEFYSRAASGEPIRLPSRRVDQPNREFLTWHADTLFRAS